MSNVKERYLWSFTTLHHGRMVIATDELDITEALEIFRSVYEDEMIIGFEFIGKEAEENERMANDMGNVQQIERW